VRYTAHRPREACILDGTGAARRSRGLSDLRSLPYHLRITLLVQCEFRVQRPDKEPELGTLRYQWFVNQRPGHYTILEEYVDADAAETHNHHVHALLVEFFSVAELVSISFYGELNRYLRDWISGRDGVAINMPL